VLSQGAASNLVKFVEGGGTLVISARTGVKDEANAVVNQPLPGLLSQAAGVEVDEYSALPSGEVVPLKVQIPGASQVNAKLWVDVLTPTTAEVLGSYAAEYYAGRAAITVNRFGKGRVVYVGAFGDLDLHSLVAGWAAEQAGVSPVLVTPQDVEAVVRWHGEHKLLFLLNHSDAAQDVALDGEYEDLLAGGKVQSKVSLAPKGVMVLEG
jgi:beta-galactosidase